MSRTAFPVTKIQNSGGNCFRERETHKNNRDLIMIFAYPPGRHISSSKVSPQSNQPDTYTVLRTIFLGWELCHGEAFSNLHYLAGTHQDSKRQPTSTTLTLLSFRNNTSELIKPLLILKSEQLA